MSDCNYYTVYNGTTYNLTDLFQSGSSNIRTNYKLPNGKDLGSIFVQISQGETPLNFNTNYISYGGDLRYFFRPKTQ